jgi:Holliday junction resolvase
MSKLSREKGKRFERYVANLFKDWGYEAHRTAQYKGNTGEAGDVEGIPGIHIECKHYKAIGRVYEWYEQSERDARAAGKGELPAVIFKADAQPPMVLMHFEDWIQLYNEWNSVGTLLKKWGIADET